MKFVAAAIVLGVPRFANLMDTRRWSTFAAKMAEDLGDPTRTGGFLHKACRSLASDPFWTRAATVFGYLGASVHA